MYILMMTVSTDNGGLKWNISSKIYLTSPPAVNQQIVFDVSEDNEALALVLHVASVRHYIERDQDSNFAVVEASELAVDWDVARKLVDGITDFLDDHITECVEVQAPWYDAALEDFIDFRKPTTNPRLHALIKSIPDGYIAFLKKREDFMEYYAEKWDLIKDLSRLESASPAFGEQDQLAE